MGLAERDVTRAVLIQPRQRSERMIAAHHILRIGIYDGSGEAPVQRSQEKRAVDCLAGRQAEGYVRNTQGCTAAKLFRDPLQRIQRDVRGLAGSAHGHGQRIEDEVFLFDTVFLRFRSDLLRDGKTAVRIHGDTVIIQRQSDHRPAVLFHQWEHRVHGRPLAVHGIHERFAVIDAHGSLERVRVRAVQLQRQVRDRLDLLYRSLQHGRLVDARKPDVHVDGVHALFFLSGCFVQDIVHIPFQERLLQTLLPGGVDPFPDQHRVAA